MNRAEITRLVEDFLARGGVIVRVPAGVSGHQYGFRACARAAGRYGLLRRFGLTHMDNEARSLVLSGDLSLAAARAPLVWEAIARRGEASIEDLHRGLTLKRESIEIVIALLAKIRAIEKIEISKTRCKFRVRTSAAPSWADFLERAA